MEIEEIVPLNQEIVVSSSDKQGNVRAIFAVAKGIVSKNLLFGLCNRGKTFDNLTQNPQISIVVKNENGYFRIQGVVELFENGKILELLEKRCSPPIPIIAVLVKMTEIWDLDQDKKIE